MIQAIGLLRTLSHTWQMASEVMHQIKDVASEVLTSRITHDLDLSMSLNESFDDTLDQVFVTSAWDEPDFSTSLSMTSGSTLPWRTTT